MPDGAGAARRLLEIGGGQIALLSKELFGDEAVVADVRRCSDPARSGFSALRPDPGRPA